MNEHAGPACALSGLIVGIFAILLHDRNPPPPVPKSLASGTSSAPRVDGSKPESPASIGPPRPIATTATAAATAGGFARAHPGRCRSLARVEAPGPEAGRSPDLATRVAPPTPGHPPPPSRPPFAVVEPGEESLADVAARVYGSKARRARPSGRRTGIRSRGSTRRWPGGPCCGRLTSGRLIREPRSIRSEVSMDDAGWATPRRARSPARLPRVAHPSEL